jgi:hypothetical protein
MVFCAEKTPVYFGKNVPVGESPLATIGLLSSSSFHVDPYCGVSVIRWPYNNAAIQRRLPEKRLDIQPSVPSPFSSEMRGRVTMKGG